MFSSGALKVDICSSRSLPRALTAAGPKTSITTIQFRRAMSSLSPTQAVAMSESTIRIYDANTMTADQLKKIIARPRVDFTSILSTVSSDDSCVFALSFLYWLLLAGISKAQ